MEDADMRHHAKHHPPQVKSLNDELYRMLSSGGRDAYGAALLAQYGLPGQRIQHTGLGLGLISAICWPESADVPARTTHLIYAGCTPAQIRTNLAARGLGGRSVAVVYPPDVDLADLERDEDRYQYAAEVDDPYDD
ncbi:hypothetical protein [Solihabitans fulvus]|uniref:hypothetical protein n=1 Tax=Solihabitans fulvus TaxID=1892852 RepID=UPI001CB766E7|nr:hypothetical protein [Solihabitans fulvus]